MVRMCDSHLLNTTHVALLYSYRDSILRWNARKCRQLPVSCYGDPDMYIRVQVSSIDATHKIIHYTTMATTLHVLELARCIFKIISHAFYNLVLSVYPTNSDSDSDSDYENPFSIQALSVFLHWRSCTPDPFSTVLRF
jgi:hypothetical protein